MASPNNFTRRRQGGHAASAGITLVEILLVIGLFTVVVGCSMLVGMESLRGDSFRSGRNLLITALQHARSQAVNNICLGATCTNGMAHGVHIEVVGGTVTKFVIFQGATYSAADPINVAIDVGGNVSKTLSLGGGSQTDVVFTQLSGASTHGTVVLIDNTGHISTISIGSDGQMQWTN